ncbi:MAG: TIGR01212 family radical SAM protein, partial [Clostridia bacterium]|nr:TIGR01212 family radical SAM protein [Clostridia bacterium]
MYINTFDRAMRERFGRKMYRLSLDCGFTCPNRDGTAGVGGCIFCSAGGAGNFAGRGDSLDEKLFAAKEKIRTKTGENCGYIAYFQSFT